MATQHPDNAGKPWWHDDPFITTQDEIDEVLLLFKELPIDEYMWDWEGKYVDEAVGEKLYSRAHEFFAAHPLGEDFHLTFRIPAYEEGKLHRMARAFMNLLSLSDLGAELKLPRPPVTEMFLPLTESAHQLIGVRKTFRDIADYHRHIFHSDREQHDVLREQFQVTPLVEDVESMFTIEKILQPYWDSLKAEGTLNTARGQRVFLARSDPAMNAGLVPAVLAIKSALSKLDTLGEQYATPVHPIIGTGSLPFRGSVNPQYTAEFLAQYAGVRTYCIQSAFRYDYPLDQVRSALETIQQEAPARSAERISVAEQAQLREAADLFSAFWKPSVEALADIINDVAQYVPGRRERLQHVGLFGYSRGLGKVTLPRAIKFTGALYSIGVPPELIATGRGLAAARGKGLLPLVERMYPAMRADLKHAGKYLNRENLGMLAAKVPAFADVQQDVALIEQILGITLAMEKPKHVVHRNYTSTILHRLNEDARDAAQLTEDIVEAGVLRRSLG
jgi:phosphoenolpyruvate carboxylase